MKKLSILILFIFITNLYSNDTKETQFKSALEAKYVNLIERLNSRVNKHFIDYFNRQVSLEKEQIETLSENDKVNSLMDGKLNAINKKLKYENSKKDEIYDSLEIINSKIILKERDDLKRLNIDKTEFDIKNRNVLNGKINTLNMEFSNLEKKIIEKYKIQKREITKKILEKLNSKRKDLFENLKKEYVLKNSIKENIVKISKDIKSYLDYYENEIPDFYINQVKDEVTKIFFVKMDIKKSRKIEIDKIFENLDFNLKKFIINFHEQEDKIAQRYVIEFFKQLTLLLDIDKELFDRITLNSIEYLIENSIKFYKNKTRLFDLIFRLNSEFNSKDYRFITIIQYYIANIHIKLNETDMAKTYFYELANISKNRKFLKSILKDEEFFKRLENKLDINLERDDFTTNELELRVSDYEIDFLENDLFKKYEKRIKTNSMNFLKAFSLSIYSIFSKESYGLKDIEILSIKKINSLKERSISTLINKINEMIGKEYYSKEEKRFFNYLLFNIYASNKDLRDDSYLMINKLIGVNEDEN